MTLPPLRTHRPRHYARTDDQPRDELGRWTADTVTSHVAHQESLRAAIEATPGYAILRQSVTRIRDAVASGRKAARDQARHELTEHYRQLADTVLRDNPGLRLRPNAVRNMGRRFAARLFEDVADAVRAERAINPDSIDDAFYWTAGDALGPVSDKPDSAEMRALESAFLGTARDPRHRRLAESPIGSMTPDERAAWHAGHQVLSREDAMSTESRYRYSRLELAVSRCQWSAGPIHRYSEDQPRVPAGSPEGGQFASKSETPEKARKPRPNPVVARDEFEQFIDHVGESEQDASNRWIDFEELTAETGDLTGKLLREPLAGYRRVIDAAAIRHILRGHSDPAELDENELPVTKQDIKSIPEIIANPDRISITRNHRGILGLRYQKRVNGHIFFVEEVRTGRRKLAVVTMWKLMSSKSKSSPTLPHTSETDLPLKQARAAVGDDSPNDRPDKKNVNTDSRDKHARLQHAVAYVHRYSERWITINGGSAEDGEGGGTPVKIDDDGTIVGGPQGLADKGIHSLSDFGRDSSQNPTAGSSNTVEHPTFAGGVATTPDGHLAQWKTSIAEEFRSTGTYKNGRPYEGYSVTKAQKRAALQHGLTAETFADQYVSFHRDELIRAWAENVARLPDRRIEVPDKVMRLAQSILKGDASENTGNGHEIEADNQRRLEAAKARADSAGHDVQFKAADDEGLSIRQPAEESAESARQKANRRMWEDTIRATFKDEGDVRIARGGAQAAADIAKLTGARRIDVGREFLQELKHQADAAGANWQVVQEAAGTTDPGTLQNLTTLSHRAWKQVTQRINTDSGKLVLENLDDLERWGLDRPLEDITGAHLRDFRIGESAVIVSDAFEIHGRRPVEWHRGQDSADETPKPEPEPPNPRLEAAKARTTRRSGPQAGKKRPPAPSTSLAKRDALKEQHADAMVLIRVGDFYELYKDDAKSASRMLGLTLTHRAKASEEPVPMAGFPHHQLEGYLQRLAKSGTRTVVANADGKVEKVQAGDESAPLRPPAPATNDTPAAPRRPVGIPGQQMGLFEHDAHGQRQLFNMARPDKAGSRRETPVPQKSTLEQITDDLKQRSDDAAPLPGQRTLSDQYARKSPTETRWINLRGSNVRVNTDGQILDGCPGLKGEHIRNLIGESEESRKTREARQAHATARGLTGHDVTAGQARRLSSANRVREYESAKQAAKDSGHSVADVLKALPDAHQFSREQHDLQRRAISNAMKRTGLTPSKANRWEDRGFDHSSWPEFDDWARIAAAEDPNLGLDKHAHDTPARVWDLIRDFGQRTARDESHSPNVAKIATEMLGRPRQSSRRARRDEPPESADELWDMPASDFRDIDFEDTDSRDSEFGEAAEPEEGDTTFDPDKFSRFRIASARAAQIPRRT